MSLIVLGPTGVNPQDCATATQCQGIGGSCFPLCNSPACTDPGTLRPAIKDYATLPFGGCSACVWDGIFRKVDQCGCGYSTNPGDVTGCTKGEWGIEKTGSCGVFQVQLEQVGPLALKWAGQKSFSALPASLLGVYTRAPQLSSSCISGSSDCSPSVTTLEIIAVVPPP